MPTTPEPKEFNRPALRTFESLAPGVRDWITSSDASSIILEINERHHNDGGFAIVIPRLITRVLVGSLAIEEFHRALAYYLPLLGDRQIADICLSVKNRILRPVSNSLTGLYAINPEHLRTVPTPFAPTSAPAARVVVAEKTIGAPSAAPRTAPRSVPVAPAQPKARVMEMSGNMIDLRRAPTAQKPTPAESPKARTMETQSPIGITTTPQAAVRAAQKNTDEAAVLEVSKPFGLSESMPAPKAENAENHPPKNAVVRYHDEHPVAPHTDN